MGIIQQAACVCELDKHQLKILKAKVHDIDVVLSVVGEGTENRCRKGMVRGCYFSHPELMLYPVQLTYLSLEQVQTSMSVMHKAIDLAISQGGHGREVDINCGVDSGDRVVETQNQKIDEFETKAAPVAAVADLIFTTDSISLA